jgi:hypothetical protein
VEEAIGHFQFAENSTPVVRTGSEYLSFLPSLSAFDYSSVNYFIWSSDSEPQPPQGKKGKKAKKAKKAKKDKKDKKSKARTKEVVDVAGPITATEEIHDLSECVLRTGDMAPA